MDDNMFDTGNQEAIPQDEVIIDMKPEKPKKNHKEGKKVFKRVVVLVVCAAFLGGAAGLGYQGALYLNKDKESGISQEAIDEIDHTATIKDDSLISAAAEDITTPVTRYDVSPIYNHVLPAIVAINCSGTMTQYDFFGRKYEQDVSSTGTGIIISQSDHELLIVTNNHVVSGATAMEIVFADETKAMASLVGTESGSDLALVSVKLSDLSKETKAAIRIATLGDSDTLKQGEMVLALGNALGYGQSLTVGSVSALNREVTVDGVTLELIQTDAAINPGNSGGALINSKGEIIGINSVKYVDTDVERVGYAIPISTAIPIINDMMNREELSESEQAYLGIYGKDVEEEYSTAFGVPVGVYVYEVTKGSAAEKAGLKKGDVIVELNGKKIGNMSDLQSKLQYTKGGSEAEIVYKKLENGEYVDKTVTVTMGYRK